MKQFEKIYLQITSGRGPVECCRAVALVLKKIREAAERCALCAEIVDAQPGPVAGTLLSATVAVTGDCVGRFVDDWRGSILWVARSIDRPHHPRKNWFVGVNAFAVEELADVCPDDIRYETLRASGPGGQHVNKTESAVRAIHRPTGVSVVAADERSQWQNRQLARERLLLRLRLLEEERRQVREQAVWNNHNRLERGNPAKVFCEAF